MDVMRDSPVMRDDSSDLRSQPQTSSLDLSRTGEFSPPTSNFQVLSPSPLIVLCIQVCTIHIYIVGKDALRPTSALICSVHYPYENNFVLPLPDVRLAKQHT